MEKRRRLKKNQKVIIIYDTHQGFCTRQALFDNYKFHELKNVKHEIPVFIDGDKTITGLECFWLLPENAQTPEQIQKIQYELIEVQIKVVELSLQYNYDLPLKIKDTKIISMAQNNLDRLQTLIQKLGYDPRDEGWIETHLAANSQERNWFEFERKNPVVFMKEWQDMADLFNQTYHQSISIEDAKQLSKLRMRYILGAFHTRMSGNSNVNDWKAAAQDFERFHREREMRMNLWSETHKHQFPSVRVKEPVLFFAGPFFQQCIENVPHLFTDTFFNKIKTGTILRVISYDPESKYIRLDFTNEIRTMILGKEDKTPWLKDQSDYDMWLQPEDIKNHLEFLDKLE